MKRASLVLVLSALAFACSSSSPSGVGETSDAGGADSSPATDASVSDAGGDAQGAVDGGAASCTAAREQLLKPVDAVSTGEVSVLETSGDTKTIFVDASAGGTQGASMNPRIYVNLESLSRVAVTDKNAG